MRSFGYLRYDPKNNATQFNDWWAILKCDEGLTAYYRRWIEREWPNRILSKDWLEAAGLEDQQSQAWPMTYCGLKLTKSVWGSHVSVVRGEKPEASCLKHWKKYENRKIYFEYNPEYINSNGRHWWVRIKSPELEDLRLELGLKPEPKSYSPAQKIWLPAPFHLTLGYAQK